MLTRRNLFKSLLAFASLLLLPGNALAKKVAVKLEKVKKLKEIGGWTILNLKGRQILFVRDAQDSIRALSPICTHKKCLVEYNPESKKIQCNCHKSIYDLEGKVLEGPAPKPLLTYEAKLNKNRIIVTIE
jgi:Rieske Fe-S protein